MSEKTQHLASETSLVINNQSYTVFGAEQVFVGKSNPDKQEIVKDDTTGLNYSRDAVEAYEIYNLRKQKHRCWFIIDLETGGRGWYPGCEIHGAIVGDDIAMMTEPKEDSEQILSLSNSLVKILDATDIKQLTDLSWYHVAFGKTTGYIKSEYISDIKYADPFK